MNVVECRACARPYNILPKDFQSCKYHNNILCFDCWKKDAVSKVKHSECKQDSGAVTAVESRKNKSQKAKEGGPAFSIGDIAFMICQGFEIICALVVESRVERGITYYSVLYEDYIIQNVSDNDIFKDYLSASSSNK